MTLRAEQIAQLLKEGQQEPMPDDPLVISPHPNLEVLEKSGSASIDLRLGTWFLNLRQARMSHVKVVKDREGRIGESQLDAQFTKMHYVPFGTSYYLHPRNFVLGITLEWLRLPKYLTGFLLGRSSWGRRGLIIATATGVHPGFCGCLTLELTNLGEIPVSIKPGMEICQLCLNRAEGSSERVDSSQYVGLRKPKLGRIDLDGIAEKLTEAYSVE